MNSISNQKIARILNQIADYLEIDGENSFKVAAYRKVAQSIEQWQRPLIEESNLKGISGIGEGIATVIQELLRTGESTYLNELKQKIPSDLFILLRIPGLGPKSIGRLYRELGIDSIEKLEEAAKKRKIRNLTGFGAKTELKIIRGLQQMKEKPSRIPIAIAYPIAQEIKEKIRHFSGVERIQLAGSLRRFCETVKDIDFVISTSKESEVAEAILELPKVSEVIRNGENQVSVMMEYIWPIQVNFFIVPPERYTSALFYYTGSKSHHRLLMEMGEEQGLMMDEHGTGLLQEDVTFETEEEIYRSLQLSFIPPEIREGTREVELASKNEIPRLIRLEDIQGDIHMHTNWSDGGNTIEEMADAAYIRGYRYIAITDHSRSLKVANGLSIERLLQQKEKIKEIERHLQKRMEGFRILCGIEMDILSDGMLDYPDEVLQEMDLVIGSIHSAFKQDENTMTKRIIKAIENNHVDIIAHPTGRLIGRRDPYPVNMDVILKAAKETGTAIELNANPNRLDLKPEYLQKAVEEYGVLITINTDAHSILELNNMEIGVGTARRGWVRPESVINTWPIDQLLAHLKRND